jgi:hypothetical protein
VPTSPPNPQIFGEGSRPVWQLLGLRADLLEESHQVALSGKLVVAGVDGEPCVHSLPVALVESIHLLTERS